MNNYRGSRFWVGRTAHNILRGLLVALAAVAASSITSAQDKKDEVASTYSSRQGLLIVFALILSRNRARAQRWSAGSSTTQ